MPLNTSALSAALQNAFMANLPSPTPAQVNQLHMMSSNIAMAITTFIETATINYTSGLVAPPSGGPVTGAFVGTLS